MGEVRGVEGGALDLRSPAKKAMTFCREKFKKFRRKIQAYFGEKFKKFRKIKFKNFQKRIKKFLLLKTFKPILIWF